VVVVSVILLILSFFSRLADLPASFAVWLCSPEARFLKNKFVWANWDVDEMKARANQIQNSPLFTMGLAGWPVLPDEPASG